MIALAAGAAHAQQGGDLENLNEQILNNPQDATLNMRYAQAAEAAGKPRLALAAYERILINDPSNDEARRGYERVRRAMEPGYVVTRLEAGARWDSNALNSNEDVFSPLADEREATTYFAKMMVASEEEFLGWRWRSIIGADIEKTPDLDVIDYGYVGAQTGPIIYSGPHLALIPSVGAGVSWLGGNQYFSEAHLSMTLEGRTTGASYWWRLRGGYRDYNEDEFFFFTTTPTDKGPYAEFRGGITKPRMIFERGTLLVAPFVRWSDVEGSIFNFWIFDNLSPGSYFEWGADVNYNYQLTDRIQLSAGALVRERNFNESIREDVYVSPQASVTFSDMLPCNCDVVVQYRNRDSDLNDFTADYNANQASLSLRARF